MSTFDWIPTLSHGSTTRTWKNWNPIKSWHISRVWEWVCPYHFFSQFISQMFQNPLEDLEQHKTLIFNIPTSLFCTKKQLSATIFSKINLTHTFVCQEKSEKPISKKKERIPDPPSYFACTLKFNEMKTPLSSESYSPRHSLSPKFKTQKKTKQNKTKEIQSFHFLATKQRITNMLKSKHDSTLIIKKKKKKPKILH